MSMIPGCSWGINVINPCDSQGGLSDAAKAALLECFAHVAWADEHGQDYYDALYDALYNISPGANVTSISAVFNQGGNVIYDTDSLDSLKQYLTVTADWSDGSTTTVPSASYTLLGTLTVGTSTITVSYEGHTDTFTVMVTHYTIPMLYNWDFTQSLTDTEQGVTVTSASGRNPTQNSTGLVFNAAIQQITVPVSIDLSGKTLELDVASMVFAGNTSYHIRLLMLNDSQSSIKGNGPLIWRSGNGWSAYGSTAATGTTGDWAGQYWSASLTGSTSEVINAFSEQTIKIVFDSDGKTMSLYRNNVLEGIISTVYFVNTNMRYIHIGGLQSGAQNAGNQVYNATITGMRIYNTV